MTVYLAGIKGDVRCLIVIDESVCMFIDHGSRVAGHHHHHHLIKKKTRRFTLARSMIAQSM